MLLFFCIIYLIKCEFVKYDKLKKYCEIGTKFRGLTMMDMYVDT